MVLELGRKLTIVTPVVLDIPIVLLLDEFDLGHLFQAVQDWLFVYGMYCAVTGIFLGPD